MPNAGNNDESDRSAVILLSGGLDSATVLAMARREGYACHALSIDYGQRHRGELSCAADVARALGAVDHRIIGVDLRAIGGSALTADIDVPHHGSVAEIGSAIPITYVPARNLVFLSLALARAESLGARHLFMGVNAVDYSGYPDCRPEFIRAFEATANLATRAGVEGRPFTIHTPIIAMTKAEIIRAGVSLGVDYGLTTSCYDPAADGAACSACDACLLRRQGFVEAGVKDPTRYGTTSREFGR